jgi:hypothetical protein
VAFAGLSASFGGSPVVNAYGTNANYCKIVSWGPETVNIQCYTAGGVAADTQFNVIYFR